MDKNHVPDWKLERYLLGELPSKEQSAIAALEQSDGELRGRIGALRASNDEILAKYPPARMAAEAMSIIRRKRAAASESRIAGAYARGGSHRQRGLGGVPRWAIPAFACAALLVLLPVYILPILTPPGEDGMVAYEDRVKGGVTKGPVLEVWRKAGSEAERLTPESDARAGDIVQLRYIVPKPSYGALFSMDGRGVLTVHLSGDNGNAAQLTPGRPVALSTAYQLDDAPRYEAFYLITASGDFDLEDVKAALLSASHPIEGEQGLSLPKKQVTAFTLKKIEEQGIF